MWLPGGQHQHHLRMCQKSQFLCPAQTCQRRSCGRSSCLPKGRGEHSGGRRRSLARDSHQPTSLQSASSRESHILIIFSIPVAQSSVSKSLVHIPGTAPSGGGSESSEVTSVFSSPPPSQGFRGAWKASLPHTSPPQPPPALRQHSSSLCQHGCRCPVCVPKKALWCPSRLDSYYAEGRQKPSPSLSPPVTPAPVCPHKTSLAILIILI